MSAAGELLRNSRKIVIKLGSSTISDEHGNVNMALMQNLADQIYELRQAGKDVIVVSSGAGICGVAAINKWHRKGDMNYKQALCAIGQVELMNAYKELFGKYDIHVGQILLCRDDFGDHVRSLHIRNTLFTLVDEGVIPIINENDSVSVEEISIGDNDTLGALTANLWGADILVILSDIDGVYNKNPKKYEDAKLITEVRGAEDLLKKIDTEGVGDFGTGGIVTKIHAAQLVNDYGSSMILTNGGRPDILRNLMADKEEATVFYGE